MSLPIIDPEFRDLLPPLAADEFAKLEANIIRDGCTTPIVLWQGLIADGHNRFEICTRHKLGYQTNHIATVDYPDRNAVMLWMLDNQGGRRNLADIDKISIATKKEAILAAQARERQAAAGGDRTTEDGKALLSKSTKAVEPIHTRAEAAKSAGVGQTKYDEGKVILDAVASGEAPKELLDKVRAGEVSVHKAASEIKEARVASAPPVEAKPPRNIYHARIGMEIAAKVTAHLDRITDPDKEFESALRAVIAYCEKRLAKLNK